jgi:flagellar motor switch protein FliN/FliY
MNGSPTIEALLQDVPLRVSVAIGGRTLPMRDVLALGPGAVLELDRAAGALVDVLLNERFVARGELVALDDTYAVRIVELVAGAQPHG